MSYINSEGKKVAVIGGRNFKDKERVFKILDKNRSRIKYIISGGAQGADSFADEWAKTRGFPILTFYPRWKDAETGEHRKGAGFERNWEIIKNSDVVLAFHDGQSHGTQNSIDIAKKLDKPCKIYLFTPEEPEEKEIQTIETPKTEPLTIENLPVPEISQKETLNLDYDPETV